MRAAEDKTKEKRTGQMARPILSRPGRAMSFLLCVSSMFFVMRC